MKVVYLISQHLDARNRQRFGIDLFAVHRELVGVIDLTYIDHPSVSAEFFSRGGTILDVGIDYCLPKSLLDLLLCLRKFEATDFYFDFGVSSIRAILCRMYFAFSACKRISVTSGMRPNIHLYQKKKDGFLAQRIKRLMSIVVLSRYIISRIDRAILVPDILVLTALSALNSVNSSRFKEIKLIRSHAFDYDRYLEVVSKPNNIRPDLPSDYAVFLDENEPFHPDHLYVGESPATTPAKYFSSLNAMFKFLESETNIPIIIAEHPRAAYSIAQKAKFFPDRAVLRGLTTDLIRNASYVVAQCSTAVGIAVLFKKPVLFVTSDDFENHRTRGAEIIKLAHLLSAPLVNMDHLDDTVCLNIADNKIKDSSYQSYVDDYIKYPGTQSDRNSWEILRENLLEIDSVSQ